MGSLFDGSGGFPLAGDDGGDDHDMCDGFDLMEG